MRTLTSVGRRGLTFVAAACILTCVHAACADTLDDIRARGRLIWGGDQEGGGPFVYPDPEHPAQLRGFEVELADLIASELGVRAEFFQADWNTLPEFLRAGKIDIILNGYEWSPARAARMRPTRPYYIYQLQLMARSDDERIKSWDDLRHPSGRPPYRVSAMTGTAALEWLRQNWASEVTPIEYDGNVAAMSKVRDGLDDATVQDLPIAIFYRDLPQGAGLRFVGEPVGRGDYVMFARPEDQRLVGAIDAILDRAIRDGRLKAIYDRYQLWTPAQADLASAATPGTTQAAAAGWRAVRLYGPELLRAAVMTVLISVCAMPLAILAGIGIAVGRLFGPAWLRWPFTAYVEVLRGTPVMLQLYFIFFGLPTLLPIDLQPFWAAVIGLAINYSAYEAEIYRAGLQAIPPGQMDAALALGLSRWTAIRRVILPQAVRIVVPPVTNDFIALFKDTSVCSVIAVTELTKRYNTLANSTGAILELAGMTAVLYMCMSYPLSHLAARLEERLAIHRRATA